MRVLVACEYSGRVRDAFNKRGHDAWSCDLLPTEAEGQHIQGDVLEVLEDGWDLMIAHPPCTYLSRAGGRWLYPKGKLNHERYKKLLDARQFFFKLYFARIHKIAIENPIPFKIAQLPEPTQSIQPYYFGEPYSKYTLLWLKELEPLQPTNLLSNFKSWLPSNSSGFRVGQKVQKGVSKSVKDYSTTFQGIANAMAEQWG